MFALSLTCHLPWLLLGLAPSVNAHEIMRCCVSWLSQYFGLTLLEVSVENISLSIILGLNLVAWSIIWLLWEIIILLIPGLRSDLEVLLLTFDLPWRSNLYDFLDCVD